MPTASYLAKLYFLGTATAGDIGVRASWGAPDAVGRAAGAAPTHLIEAPNVADVEIPLIKTKTEVTTRLAGGVKAYKGTLKDIDLTIPQVYDTADLLYVVMLTAMLTDVTVPLAFLDGPDDVDGTEGVWGDFEVLEGSLGQKIDGVQMYNWKVAPGWSTVPLEHIIVTG